MSFFLNHWVDVYVWNLGDEDALAMEHDPGD